MTFDVVDLYAGPGGWDEGMKTLGLTGVVGLEWDHAACLTATTAGHRRIRADVSKYCIDVFAGVQGLIASPPCQAWSMAGKRQGEVDRAKVHALVDAYANGADEPGDGWADERSHHAAQPVRWVRQLRPRWAAFEQVPAVLGLWEHAAERFRRWGYSTWTGILNAADFGVPQTRERAILVARLDGPALPPAPTHARDAGDVDLFGGSLPPWVSMAEALGWSEQFEVVSNYGNNGDPRNRGRRTGVQPSSTMTSKANRMKITGRAAVYRRTAGGYERLNEGVPAPTVKPGNPSGASSAPRFDDLVVLPTSRPFIGTEEARQLVGAPTHTARISVTEAAVLQSFRPTYPWRGTKTKQLEQIGNAVPPLLAAHITAAATGRTFERDAISDAAA